MTLAIAEARPAAIPAEKDTTVGNYFVSNYPPFSFWKPERVPEVAAALGRPPAPGTKLGLYLHIPFCRKRCHFCYFKVYTDKDSTAIKGYLELALRELELYGNAAVHRRPQAAICLFRRRHTLLSVRVAAPAPGRPDEGDPELGRRRRGNV